MTLPWIRLVLRNIQKRNLYTTTKCTSLFYESPDKDGFQNKSDEEKDWEKMSLKDRILLEYNLLKEGFKEWTMDITEKTIRGPRVILYENQVDFIYKFTGDSKELNKWIITTDKDNNLGFSTAQLELTRNSKGIFHGYLDTKLPPDGIIKNTGYCNLKLTPRLSPFKKAVPYDWDQYTHLVFRVRGDGRVYTVNLHNHVTVDLTQYDTWHYFIWTRGGPYWQYVRIPFSKFVFAYKGRVQSANQIVPQGNIDSISFTIADKTTGPFKLEIDFIGTVYDPAHIEETAYEQYSFDQKFL